jgi:hypothetical protein
MEKFVTDDLSDVAITAVLADTYDVKVSYLRLKENF